MQQSVLHLEYLEQSISGFWVFAFWNIFIGFAGWAFLAWKYETLSVGFGISDQGCSVLHSTQAECILERLVLLPFIFSSCSPPGTTFSRHRITASLCCFLLIFFFHHQQLICNLIPSSAKSQATCTCLALLLDGSQICLDRTFLFWSAAQSFLVVSLQTGEGIFYVEDKFGRLEETRDMTSESRQTHIRMVAVRAGIRDKDGVSFKEKRGRIGELVWQRMEESSKAVWKGKQSKVRCRCPAWEKMCHCQM